MDSVFGGDSDAVAESAPAVAKPLATVAHKERQGILFRGVADRAAVAEPRAKPRATIAKERQEPLQAEHKSFVSPKWASASMRYSSLDAPASLCSCALTHPSYPLSFCLSLYQCL
jgi:hypothetical protein